MSRIDIKATIILSSLLSRALAWQALFLPPQISWKNIYQNNDPASIRCTNTQLCDSVSATNEEVKSADDNEEVESLCYYKTGDKWKQRIKIEELRVGQKIKGERIGTADLLNAKTGPKIFFECGIGRIDSKGDWQMVSGMYRVAKNYAKPKVVRKKVQRLSGKEVDLYVTKIRMSEGKLEVCATIEEFEREMEKIEKRGPMVSVSSLNIGQEVIGTVVDVRDYGVMVDVGANRRGLLHIQKVADLYGKYINKEEGLIEAGLERGAKVKLCVKSNEKKRLFLDFTQETKDLSITEAETAEETAATGALENKENELNQQESTDINNDQSIDPYEDEAAAWASYYEEEEDDDEDRDIEDALGIGYY